MDLKVSKIYRKLDAKWKIGGLEAPDLLFVLIFAATMNLFFGKTFLVIPLVLILPLTLTAVLYFGKRNKPDQYLLHFIKFYLTPGFYSAGEKSKFNKRNKIYD